ncbi:hypothetical protein [Phormidesmis sp. 146-33]
MVRPRSESLPLDVKVTASLNEVDFAALALEAESIGVRPASFVRQILREYLRSRDSNQVSAKKQVEVA